MRLTSVLRFTTTKKAKKGSVHTSRIFSGIQPTGTLHLGNYFGAVDQWIKEIQSLEHSVPKLPKEYDRRLFCVVDLHARYSTTPQKPEDLRLSIHKMTASLIGCGLDPEKAIIFQQSHVHEHSELFGIFFSELTASRLQRLSQFKEKSSNFKEVPLGLLLYPVLQAADILLYKATDVPVGEDQLQNVELTRKIASKFNSKHKCKLFPIPNIVLVKDNHGSRIKSLKEPEKKMSKSDYNQKSCLYLLDDADTIRSKIKGAVTDFTSEVTFEPATRPGVSNLVCIHSRITGQDPQTICDEVSGLNTGQYKVMLSDIVIGHFKPMRQKTMDLLQNKDHLEAILKKGSQRAQIIASETLDEVKSVIGVGVR